MPRCSMIDKEYYSLLDVGTYKNDVPSKLFPLYLMMKQVKRSVATERHLFRVGLSRHFQRRYRDTSMGLR